METQHRSQSAPPSVRATSRSASWSFCRSTKVCGTRNLHVGRRFASRVGRYSDGWRQGRVPRAAECGAAGVDARSLATGLPPGARGRRARAGVRAQDPSVVPDAADRRVGPRPRSRHAHALGGSGVRRGDVDPFYFWGAARSVGRQISPTRRSGPIPFARPSPQPRASRVLPDHVCF